MHCPAQFQKLHNPISPLRIPEGARESDMAFRRPGSVRTGGASRLHGRPQAKSATSILLAIQMCAGASVAAADDYDIEPASQCCVDIDRRVAELEELGARRGNRKVKVQISGLVNNSIMAWDDGGESSVYVVTNDNQRSRFSFVGSAKISEMLEAGMFFDVGIRTANSKLVNQVADGNYDGRPPTGFDLRSSVWYLRHKKYGAGFVGATFAATDRIANSNVTQTAMFDHYAAPENFGLGMLLRSASNGRMTDSLLSWRRIIGAGGDQPGESQRGFQLIKYVTPTVNGFTAAVDWVVADFWDAALRYRKEVAGFDIGAGIGYLQLLPDSRTRSVCPAAILATNVDTSACKEIRGSISAKHLETGLFVNFGANLTMDGIIPQTNRFRGTGAGQTERFLSGQVGLEREFNTLGKTTIYGSYYTYTGGPATAFLAGPGDALNPTGLGSWSVWNSSVNIWGIGVAQGIDAASTILYLNYRRASGDLFMRELLDGTANGAIAASPIDDLDLLMSGAVIRF